ncbi:MAG: helicase-exonuclease AddAB subunit AddA [Lachnospiraceae bacterium]|nr:helicase-exonuclease AddAB subunit AddA [Lachnospiraceae bacterium]
MAVKWTQEQQRVIDTRDCDILVSAAAGSGKTAVLVARILSIITDKEKPVDIDRLLVVTFTNAAAGEMRERIREALERRAEEEPDNIHLQRQLVLVHNAKITTIHSFCLNVLRNHFQIAGIDPAFRIADTGEITLLEQETVHETVAEAYENAGESFHEFVEGFATGKSDQIIENTVLSIYHYALGQPWPKEWLESCCRMYPRLDFKSEDVGLDDTYLNSEIIGGCENESVQKEVPDEFGENSEQWIAYIEQDTEKILADADAQIRRAIGICEEPDGPYPYLKALQDDLRILEKLRSASTYEEYAQAFECMPSYTMLGRKKDESIAEEKKLLVQDLRAGVKDAIASLHQQYYFDKMEVLRKEYAKSGEYIREIVKLTEAFMERLAARKAEKNILDFGDLEHFALRTLVKQQDGKTAPTAAAEEYAEMFEEIMIDEYQDSNLVQELILKSVSGRGRGEHNLFMVGDVKQSIYRFRLARPELFMEKYRTYKNEDDSTSCRIDLHKNFRSREQVLGSVNYLFRQIMTEGLGGIEYDSDAALYPGAVFEKRPQGEAFLETEFLLLDAQTQTKQETEARLIGRRIREIVGKEEVLDKETGAYRSAKYGDIVILLRTVSGWAETFGEILGDMGIPCFTGSQKGYFSAAEVRTVLAYLQILDNPVQDIPLASVLRSAIGGLTDEELAVIRSSFKERHFYDCVQAYRVYGDNKELCGKLDRFFEVFDRLRTKCAHTPVHLLIWEMLEMTGYGAYAQALPAGSQRKANLDMLIEKAISYESTSYRGLYHFVRYIENLKKYEVDYGEANTGTEADNTVRIMSIHKSKGLEFPIVFVSGLGKQFNESDVRSKVVMHPEFGLACDCVDTKLRTRQPSILKKTIQKKTAAENLGEELRVLYVALTRAKEKLILTGCVSDAQSKLNRWQTASLYEGEALTYSDLTSASTYLDWIVPALLHKMKNGVLPEESHFSMQLLCEEEEAVQETWQRSDEAIRLAQLMNLPVQECFDEETRVYLDSVFEAVYPYEADAQIVGKLSVSELKKLSYVPEEEDAQEMYRPETVIPLLPEFREKKQTLHGAKRGTAYHTFMENLDYSKKDELEIQLEELISCGKMSEEEGKTLCLNDIRTFLETESGKRMERAALSGCLRRERPFVLGIPADHIREEWNPQETVLVQGIIDAYFIEDGQITVLDYKTDRVMSSEELVMRYRAQLDYYALALERLTDCHIKDKIIYSFHLGEDIIL